MNIYIVTYALKSNPARRYLTTVKAVSEFEARKLIKKRLKNKSFRILAIEKSS